MSGKHENITAQHQGRRYRVQRSTTDHDNTHGCTHEYWEGHGVIGSQRKWLGHHYTRRLYWYAAVNPTGQPYAATCRVNDLPTRRAAITWLLAHS